MSWLSRALRRGARGNLSGRVFDAVGLRQNDPIRGIISPMSVLKDKIANDEVHTAADVTDPGNFFHAAPAPEAAPYTSGPPRGLTPNPNSGGPTINFGGNDPRYVNNQFTGGSRNVPTPQTQPPMAQSQAFIPQTAMPQAPAVNPRTPRVGGGRAMMF